MGIGVLIWLFILSIFLPPLGLGLTIRYIKSEDQNAKAVGWVSLIVTIIAIVVAILLTIAALGSVNQQINSQLQDYQF